MNRTFTLLAISTVLACLPAAALAKSRKGATEPCTADIPTTQMDKVLRDTVTGRFGQVDLDHNGGLSRAELQKTPAKAFPNLKKHFREMDTDRNGEIALTERDAWVRRHSCKK